MIVKLVLLLFISIVLSIDSKIFKTSNILKALTVFKHNLMTIFISTSMITMNPYVSNADLLSAIESNELKPNYLMNPLLETYRKIDQIEPDESYTKNSNRALYMIPIVAIYNDMSIIYNKLSELLIDQSNLNTICNNILETLNDPVYEIAAFKTTFNLYADNIYYSDPDRANLYLGGGATPSTAQTQQYLLRNDILSRINDLRDDINFILQNDNDLVININDAVEDSRKALESLILYFDVSTPQDVEIAKKIFFKNRYL